MTTDHIKGRADKESMVTVIKGTPTCSALRGITVVKTVEVLTTGKMSSEKLRDQCGFMAGVSRGPGQGTVNKGHGPKEITLE